MGEVDYVMQFDTWPTDDSTLFAILNFSLHTPPPSSLPLPILYPGSFTMRSSRVRLLLGVLLVVIFLFSTVNAHGDHGHGHSHRKPATDDLEDDEFTTPPEAESTPVKKVELPTFTVSKSTDNC